jgi:hypothetical protein
VTPTGTDQNSLIQLDVAAGRRYYLRVSGYGFSSGSYRLAFGAIKADDFGSDFATTTGVLLSEAGIGEREGTIEDPEDVDVFRLEIPSDHRLVVTLTPALGSTLVTDLRVFTLLDGLLTQVASDQVQSGRLQLDVVGGRTYFIRVAPTGQSSGAYRLALHTEAAAGPVVAIREAGKGAFDQLRESFVRAVPGIGPAPEEAQRAADAISDDVVRRFLVGLGGLPKTAFLLVWVDPVDFRATDPQHRLAGYTADQGAINEQGGGFFSGDGVLELLITPQTSTGRFSLELIGVGPDQVLFGARLILPDGTVLVPPLPRCYFC